MTGYIYIPNWTSFQHYRDQTNPAWIKSYRKLLSNDDYLALSHADRGLLHDVWLLSANDGEGRVSADRRLLARRLNVRRVSLEPLINAGFIQIRSRKRLDKPYRRSRAEGEAEVEKNSPKAERLVVPDSDAAIQENVPNQGRVDAITMLMATIGTDADKNTLTTIHRLIITKHLAEADIQLARERVAERNGNTNRAKYAYGVLRSIAKDRAEGVVS